MTAGTLYVVATPLGNLDDLSSRAARILGEVRVVAAEDTRRSRILLDHLGVRPRLVSFHQHSTRARLQELLDALARGESVAVLTDAGTPVISDPGGAFVRQAQESGIRVVPVPGPSAVTTALSVGGFPADAFLFLGFVPRKGRERTRVLEEIERSPRTVVVFETAPRLERLLEDLDARVGDRRVTVCRELTKVHEQVHSGTLAELRGYYRESPARGEITLVIGGSEATVPEVDLVAAEARARELVDGGASRRDTASQLAREFGVSRNEAYRIVMEST